MPTPSTTRRLCRHSLRSVSKPVRWSTRSSSTRKSERGRFLSKKPSHNSLPRR